MYQKDDSLMHFPAALHLPSIFGVVLGVGFFMRFWPADKPLAISLLVILTAGGILLGLWLAGIFFRGKKDE